MRLYIFSLLMLLPLSVMGGICATDHNVKDYFLSIPHESLMIFDDESGPLTTQAEREQAIDAFDSRNGFIELQNNTIISLTQITLFRGKENRPVIMVTSDGASVQNVYAFICKNEKWIEITGFIFPELSYKEIAKLYNSNNSLPGKVVSAGTLEPVVHTLVRYKLPRYGKKIQAYASHPDIDAPEEKVLFEFVPELGGLPWN